MFCQSPPQLELVPATATILGQVCEPVAYGTAMAELIEGMFDLLDYARGVGLAAPQVGVALRVIVINYAATTVAIINPVITKAPGKIVRSLNEGCLSFPGARRTIKRSKRVIVEGFDKNWEPVKIDARNFLAFVVQHEIDHLDGVTIV